MSFSVGFALLKEKSHFLGIMGWIEVILIGLIGQAWSAPKPDQVSGTATVGVSTIDV